MLNQNYILVNWHQYLFLWIDSFTGGMCRISLQISIYRFTFAVDFWWLEASLLVQLVKNLPAIQETPVQFLGQENPLEKGTATHSCILAWRIPWTCVVHRFTKSWTWLSDFQLNFLLLIGVTNFEPQLSKLLYSPLLNKSITFSH